MSIGTKSSSHNSKNKVGKNNANKKNDTKVDKNIVTKLHYYPLIFSPMELSQYNSSINASLSRSIVLYKYPS